MVDLGGWYPDYWFRQAFFSPPSECSAHCYLSKDAYASTDTFGNRVTLAGLCQGLWSQF